ncbi:MAG: hypothetical protein FWC03_04970 [Treponema sp.]|nr:hypothetical protein [Treponema sp.]
MLSSFFLTGIVLTSCGSDVKDQIIDPPNMSLAITDPLKFNIYMDKNKINISWDEVSNAESYDIYRAGSRLGKYTYLKTVTRNTYTDSKPNPVKYENYYLITANNKSGKILDMIISFELKMFGGNIKFYDIKYDDISRIEEEINRIHDREMFGSVAEAGRRTAEFSVKRYALYFKPGEYKGFSHFKIGFYTHAGGLGKVPSETNLFGSIHTPPHLPDNNATCTFWRSIENFEISGGIFRWGVSQASPVRRMKVNVPAVFDWYNGWASGGYSSDSYFADSAGSWSQQQWYSRNCHHENGLFGINWNKFVQGATGKTTDSNWETGESATKIDTTPVIREKPFLYFEDGRYKVFIPALRKEASGVSWTDDFMGDGFSLDLEDEFHITIEGTDTSQSINAALDNGKHVFFTPGRYELSEPLRIRKPGTVVLGTGLATLIPAQENIYGAIFIDDVDNVTIAGLIIDAYYSSEYLICAGGTMSDNDHRASPSLLSDIFLRVGGYTQNPVHATAAAIINSNDIIGDHFWVWRADHGQGIGWDRNTSKNGVVVTGDRVIFYGLFVEHFHEYQTFWSGENGRMYFYQSETPYDPVNQNGYMSHNGTVNGWASYKVANNVNNHFASGLGIYAVFIHTGQNRNKSESIFIDNAIEVPDKPGVIVHHACILDLSGAGGVSTGIRSIVNGTGTGVMAGTGRQSAKREYLIKYNNGKADTYSPDKTGIQPDNEVFSFPVNLLP